MSLSLETYKAFAEFYDMYVGKYAEDLEFYKSLCKPNDLIIEIGCGTGRVLKYLLENNISLHGVDISDEMLEKANTKLNHYILSKKLVLYNHDYTDESTETEYNKALITFYTFNYIIKSPSEFLKNVYCSLSQNGEIVMDLFYPKTLVHKELENKWTEQKLKINNQEIYIRDKRKIDNNFEQRIQIFTIKGVSTEIETFRRYFPPLEITKLLIDAGFKNIQLSSKFEIDNFSQSINENDLKQNYIVKAIKP